MLNSEIAYTYDALGRRVTMTDDTGTTNYRYDDIGQLTKVTQPDGRVIEYQYDAAGNRKRVVDSLLGTTDYVADNENQITQVGSDVYAYDADGNLQTITDSGGTTTYTFDDLNQLTGISGPEGASSFKYNALGFRTSATRDGTLTSYLIDPTGLGNVVGEYTGTNHANYVHGFGLVSQFGASGTGYYDFDGVGNTIGITGAGQTYVNRYRYLPFGETTVSGTLPNPFTFAGYVGLIQDGDYLTHMRARYYSSITGQFVSNDPIGLAGGDSNVRRYVLNSPTNYIDPTGLVWPEPCRPPVPKDVEPVPLPQPCRRPPVPRDVEPIPLPQGKKENANPETKPNQRIIHNYMLEPFFDPDTVSGIEAGCFAATLAFVGGALNAAAVDSALSGAGGLVRTVPLREFLRLHIKPRD